METQQTMPVNGREFYFSNVMIKVYQIPMLFMSSSEFEPEQSHEGTFIILIFERKTLKIRYHKYEQPLYAKKKLSGTIEFKKLGIKSTHDHWRDRESKMRKFCNYFLTLFNVRKLKPFVQFAKPQEVKELKEKVMIGMDSYFKTANEENGALNRAQSIKIQDKSELPPGIHPNKKLLVSPVKEK